MKIRTVFPRLSPPLGRRDRGVVLVTPVLRTRKVPLWYPGGWLIAAHDGRGNSTGWSLGPSDLSKLPECGFTRADSFALGPKPRAALDRALDIYVDFMSNQEPRPKWRGVLYLIQRQLTVELG
jgi:hypothetical protein